MKYIESIEQRQHLNLSTRAYNVVKVDAQTFMQSPSISGFINCLVSTFGDFSEANIPYAENRKREELRESLTDFGNSEIVTNIIDKLCKEYVTELIEKYRHLPKERQLKIRLNNSNYESLYLSEVRPEIEIYGSVGEYLKAIIEDYASHPMAERERLFFNDRFQIIDAIIGTSPKDRKLVKITLRSEKEEPLKAFILKPYKIVHDSEDNHNYLVGLSKKSKEDGKMTPASFRFSRISSMKILSHSYGSGKITKEEEGKLIKSLREKKASFLIEENQTIEVLLDKNGQKKYEQVLHIRPEAVQVIDSEIEGYKLYQFQCSSFQAMAYFMQFGSNAIITSPQSLRQEMTKRYSNAVNVYTST